MRRLILSVMLSVLSAGLAIPAMAQSEAPQTDIPETEAACLDAGGRWAVGGLAGQPLCFLPTPDAGQACTTAEECSGFCLSETGTCSTETPMFGCFGIRDLDGADVMICID